MGKLSSYNWDRRGTNGEVGSYKRIKKLPDRLLAYWMRWNCYTKLESKGFSLNCYPEGNFYVLVEEKDENKKQLICKVFGADIELFVGGTDINTLILQCDENFNRCLFYYDCNLFDMSTEEFMNCVGRI